MMKGEPMKNISKVLFFCLPFLLSLNLSAQESQILITAGSTWKYFKGMESPGEGWTQSEFDDSEWNSGPQGFGYGDDDDETIFEDMRCRFGEGEGEGEECVEGGYLTFFLRTSFETPEIDEGQKLFARISYDDGFSLFLNGEQVTRVNIPQEGSISHTMRALKAIGDAPRNDPAIVILPLELLNEGGNVLAASVHNHALTSSDASFILELVVGQVEADDSECIEHCEDKAREIRNHCLEDGGNEEACHELFLGEFEECVIGGCKDEEPEPTCEEHCENFAKERRAQCFEEGGSEGDCHAVFEEAFELCVNRECREEPELTCEEHCENFAKEKRARCFEEGGSEGDCHEVFEEAFESCVNRECREEPELTCEDHCENHAKEVRAGCLEEGGSEGDCNEASGEAFRLCIERECREEPEPTCESRCEGHAREVRNQCLEEGGSEGDCREVFENAFEECVRGECKEEPELSCEERCENHAKEVRAACLEEGDSEGDCQELFEGVFEECVRGECREEPDPELGCEDRCENHAKEKRHLCFEDGGSEGDCHEIFINAFETCLEGECEEPTDCEHACKRKARQHMEACFEEGGSERDCSEAFNVAFETCLDSEECGDDPEPEPDPEERCEAECKAEAREVRNACFEDGGSERDCIELYEETARGCFMEHCTEGEEDPEEEPKSDCEVSCSIHARQVRQSCLDEGNGEEECEELKRSALRECLEGDCEPTCEDDCASFAEREMRRCFELGGKEGECFNERQAAFAECLTGECQNENPPAEEVVFFSVDPFLRGDANADQVRDISDSIRLLELLFLGGDPLACEDAGDANDDGVLDISDSIAVLANLFLGDPQTLPEPYHTPGYDPTFDSLSCANGTTLVSN